MFGYQLEYCIDDVWLVWQNFCYLDFDVDLLQVYVYGWSVSELNKLNCYFSGVCEYLQVYIVDNMLQVEFVIGVVCYILFIGFDYQCWCIVVDWCFGLVLVLDVFNLVYGDDVISYFLDDNYICCLEQIGVYFQDLIDIDQWCFLFGLCQDWVSVIDKNCSIGSKVDDDWEKFIGWIGVLYLFDNGLVFYVSYFELFNLNVYLDVFGMFLVFIEGKQWEFGLKFQVLGSNSFYIVLLFYIIQENVVFKEFQDNFYILVGEVCFQGFELEVYIQFSDNLKLFGSYIYIDIIYIKLLDGNQGYMLNQVFKYMVLLWVDYVFDVGLFSGLSIGGGVCYVGEIWVDKENILWVLDYILVDVWIGYDFGKFGLKGLDVSFNVNNLLDKDYVVFCYSLDFCYFGEKCNVIVMVNYQF